MLTAERETGKWIYLKQAVRSVWPFPSIVLPCKGTEWDTPPFTTCQVERSQSDHSESLGWGQTVF